MGRKKAIGRRGFMKAAAISIFSLSDVKSAPKKGAVKDKKPNLVFIWTDEQRADTLAAYGNDKIHAPNLNAFAAENIVFKKAYVTQPVCTPSRCSVMTGLWPHSAKCESNNVPLPKDVKCFPELLDDPDYRSAYMGKWHLGDEIFQQHGFDEWVSIEDAYIRYYSPSRDRDARSDYHNFLVRRGHNPGKITRTFSRNYAAGLPIQLGKPTFLEKKACHFIRQNKDRPFILYVNFLEPHPPFNGPLNDEHTLDEVEIPANYEHRPGKDDPLRYRLRQVPADRADVNKLREITRNYWGLVTLVDKCVGGILDILDSLDLSDNTIVVFTSDHGDMMGSHGLMRKSVMYEEAVRVPFIMRAGGMGHGAKEIAQPVSLVDVVPTLLDLMANKRIKNLPGRSLVPVITGEETEPRDVFLQWNPGSGSLVMRGGKKIAGEERIRYVAEERTRAIVTADGWKLCLSDRDKNQLFNLKDDPLELENLFYRGGYDEIINKLKKKIYEWQRKVADDAKV